MEMVIDSGQKIIVIGLIFDVLQYISRGFVMQDIFNPYYLR